MLRYFVTAAIGFILALGPLVHADEPRLSFDALPDLPDEIGLAGPLVGCHDVSPGNDVGDFIIVAGGANFASADDPDLWILPKQYHDCAYVLQRTGGDYEWRDDIGADFRLSQPVAYSSVVNTKWGVLVVGGHNDEAVSDRAFLLSLEKSEGSWTLVEKDEVVPDLPRAATEGGAAIVGDYVYVVGGAVDNGHEKIASRYVWRLSLSAIDPSNPDPNARWEPVVSWPDEGPARMYPLVTAQHDGFKNRLYVFGGRHFPDGADKSDLYQLKFGSDCWSFDPDLFEPNLLHEKSGSYRGTSPWKRLEDSPVPIAAGTAVPLGPAHIIVPAYATGEALVDWLDSGIAQSDYEHPGFPRTALAYHTITDTWTEFGATPAAQVTSPAIRFGEDILLISGETSPRIRSAGCWRISVHQRASDFGTVNMVVVVAYLLGVLGLGVWFTLRNKTTDDYFRGGKNIPWWAAGCSIFATGLSSITYMAIPAKAFAQDWVYAMGNVMILCVAPIAVYIALPFFHRLDITSAYEYLEHRFNRGVRMIGSGSFSLFHVFRMGVVLALAALALASITPLTPAQCVLVMGVLSIIYCTLGGIEAVIWTDTAQTFILGGGAILCLYFAISGSQPGSFDAAFAEQKFHMANVDFGSMSFTTMAIWVVILGGLGQNVAIYTADQTVIQRYMTTTDQNQASRSIWLNGMLAIPSAIVFFGLGTALWMFYRSHPEKLDPSIASDRILPLFVSMELPVGLAGLVVAGIFAAAQSTVSTSMNSGATTIVTDFLRPLKVCKSDKSYLRAARVITVLMGIAGTAAGLLFVDPDIKSLFDEFISILGMFLGVLAGLFALGATTRRASGAGSLVGAAVSIITMMSIGFAARGKVIAGIDFRATLEEAVPGISQMQGYLYAVVGIVICYVVGYTMSFILPRKQKDITGLTLRDLI
ncbi:MAG: sodium:solute symporter [Planctomycetota bacterium]